MVKHKRTSYKEPDQQLPRQYSRGLALGIVCLLLFGGTWTVWVLARPLYWRLYAEVIHRYQPDPGFDDAGRQHGLCRQEEAGPVPSGNTGTQGRQLSVSAPSVVRAPATTSQQMHTS